MEEEYKIFEQLNLIKNKIDSDLNVIKNLEYDSKIKSINQYNKQLFEKLNEQEKIIEEGKNRIENNYRTLDSNLKNLENDVENKNETISVLSQKINEQNSFIFQQNNHIRDIEGTFLIFEMFIKNINLSLFYLNIFFM